MGEAVTEAPTELPTESEAPTAPPTETTTETPTETPTAPTETPTASPTCCCKSESRESWMECRAKRYKWVIGDRPGYPRPGLKNRCCTFKSGGCPFFSYYKKVEWRICVWDEAEATTQY